MYDPSNGRWLEQDPIGFEAGDANLYRMVGNDPENAIDPTGTEAEVINDKEDVKSHVSFSVGAGLLGRSAPASAGDYSDYRLMDTSHYGYHSTIRVNGDPDVINSCNTPFQLNYNDFDNHGGAIALHLRGLSSGEYDVKVAIRVVVGAQKRRPSTPKFTVYKANSDREQWQQVWQPALKVKRSREGANHYFDGAEKELTVRLKYNSGFFSSSSDSILLIPSLSFSGNTDEYMRVAMDIHVLEIRKVK